MDWMNDYNWFAIQAKPRKESLAAVNVGKLDVEVFLPRCLVERSTSASVRTVRKALFPGYFFARFCPILSLDPVTYAPGVLRVVGAKRYPIPLEPEIVSGIKGRVQADGFIRLEAKQFVAGDTVAIEHGPFAGWIGKVEREWDDGKRVMILLEAIQQARVLIEKRRLVTAA